MSSPGKASWCICVRMSPGSIDEHPEVGTFHGEHAPDVVERGLRGAVAAPARIRLDRRVGRHVDDDRAGCQLVHRGLDEAERRDDVDVEQRP